MSATYTFDVYSTLDAYGTPAPGSDWGGYWSKEGPEFLARRLDTFGEDQRLVLGSTTYRLFGQFLAEEDPESKVNDDWVTRMLGKPITVISNTLEAPFGRPDATIASGDAVDIVTRLKEESGVPLTSHGSLALNRTLMAAGLVDRVRMIVFPVITGQTGGERIFEGGGDFDLELIDSRTFDGSIKELTYAPTLHA